MILKIRLFNYFLLFSCILEMITEIHREICKYQLNVLCNNRMVYYNMLYLMKGTKVSNSILFKILALFSSLTNILFIFRLK